jgi:hypothetical protein
MSGFSLSRFLFYAGAYPQQPGEQKLSKSRIGWTRHDLVGTLAARPTVVA